MAGTSTSPLDGAPSSRVTRPDPAFKSELVEVSEAFEPSGGRTVPLRQAVGRKYAVRRDQRFPRPLQVVTTRSRAYPDDLTEEPRAIFFEVAPGGDVGCCVFHNCRHLVRCQITEIGLAREILQVVRHLFGPVKRLEAVKHVAAGCPMFE